MSDLEARVATQLIEGAQITIRIRHLWSGFNVEIEDGPNIFCGNGASISEAYKEARRNQHAIMARIKAHE